MIAATHNSASATPPPPSASSPVLSCVAAPSPSLAATNPRLPPQIVNDWTSLELPSIPSLKVTAGFTPPDLVGIAPERIRYSPVVGVIRIFAWFMFHRSRRRRWCPVGLPLRLTQIWISPQPSTVTSNPKSEEAVRFSTGQPEMELVNGELNRTDRADRTGFQAEPSQAAFGDEQEQQNEAMGSESIRGTSNKKKRGADEDLQEEDQEVQFFEPLEQA